MRIYLTVRPEERRQIAGLPAEAACTAYRIGEGSSLLCRAPLPGSQSSNLSGRLLILSDREAPAIPQPEALADALLRECARRDFSGIFLDFDASPAPDRRRLAAALSQRCAAARRDLFVPEPYARAAQRRTVLINTAVSGGDLEGHLRKVISLYGGSRNIALDIQRLRMRFSLPAPSGEGTPLSSQALDDLIKERQPAVFFSQALCAKYFVCAEGHFILFDDADTLRQKLRLGQRLGIPAAFFQWPEIQDIAGALFRGT